MNSNLIKRILTCVIGIPLIVASIFLFPMHNFIGLSFIVVLGVFVGSLEISRMVFGKTSFAVVLSTLLPILQYIQLEFELSSDIVYFYLVIAVILILAREIGISGTADNFKGSIERNSKTLLVFLYPSFLLTFLIKMFAMDNVNSYVVMLFIILVFSNDIFAYVFGILYGRKEKNGCVVKASPNKSYAGFIGGHLSCVAVCFAAFAIFRTQLPEAGFMFKVMLGLIMSFAANTGDLIESVLKRSSGVKDSGNIIPGRGGILDSTDSIMTAAPFFYLMFEML